MLVDNKNISSLLYYKNNRLQQIRGFCNTIKYGSVSKAAKVMGLTQSSVSLQIISLERDLNTKLISRNSKNCKKFELTEDGKLFYEMACPILNSTDDLYDKFFLKSQNYNEKILKIAGHHSVFSTIIPVPLKKIKDRYPELKLQLSYLTKKEAFDNLEKGNLDVAIYPIEDPEIIINSLDFIKISPYKPSLIVPKNHPLTKIPVKKITFKEIGKYNYIHTGNYYISDIMKYNIDSKVLNSDIELKNGSWDILESLVSAGLGVTIFHHDYCSKSDKVELINVHHLSPDIAYYVIFRKGSKPKMMVEKLIDFIKKQ